MATARLPFSLKIKNYNLKSIDDKILLRGAGAAVAPSRLPIFAPINLMFR